MFKTDTEKLVERCIMREQKAWEEFVNRFSGLLCYSARERLNRNGIAWTQADIEDIVQVVFVEILENNRLEQIKDRKKIKAWLSIVAQTRALNYFKGKKERLLHQDELYRIDNIEHVMGNMDMSEDRVLELEKRMLDFSPKEKIIFKLNVFYGKQHKEIARFMNMPVNTVSTIIARKKKLLRKSMEDNPL